MRGLAIFAVVSLVLSARAQAPYRIDDGSSELILGLGGPGQQCWIHGYDAVGGTDVISGVSTAIGSPMFPGASVPNGWPLNVFVWEDPNDDGDPSDAVLLSSGVSTVQFVDTDQLQTVALTSPASVSGHFFVGAMMPFNGQFETASMDDSVASLGRAWVVVNQSNTFHADVLTANSWPPLEMDSLGFHVVFMIRAERQTGASFCAGNGLGTACPCGNNSPVGLQAGCLSSLGVGGRLTANGGVNVSADTLVLSGSDMPNSFALYFQGTSQIAGGAGAVFGDGLRCAGGAIVRLGAELNSGGVSSYPQAGDLSVSVRGGVVAGNVRTYQVWYRNAAPFCSSSTFNLTNGIEVTWLP